MGRVSFLWTILCALVCGIVSVWAAPAHAAVIHGADCHRGASLEATLNTVRADSKGWICRSGEWHTGEPAAWLKFDAPADPFSAQPTELFLRLAQIESIEIYSIKDGREIAYQSHSGAAIRPADNGPYVAVPLPGTGLKAETFYVRLVGANYAATGADARLIHSAATAGWPEHYTIIVGAIFGLVCAPLFLNLTLFPALQRSFMLYHAGMSLGMLMTLSAASGLATGMLGLDTYALVTLTEIGYVLIVALGGFFAATFLEQGAISPVVRRALKGSGLLALVIAGGIAAGIPPFSWLGRTIFLLAFFPICFASLAAMAQAVQRGSLWVRYQIAAWTPAIIVGLDMTATGLGLQAEPRWGVLAPFLAMGFEVVVTGVGVAHRLLLLRRERDDAQSEARVLEKLSERDPMTGLYNRRALEDRIEALHKSGYDTFALLDLDEFKQVNDTAGHGVGDDVIRVTADVLQSDEHSLAIRLGGEEFMLVMEGGDAPDRAEKLRKAITLRVAREVEGLERLVTASMGLAVIPYSAVPNSSFEDIYALVDKLLYEAKESGRNRTVSQKLRAFRKRVQDRRSQSRASRAA